VRFSVVYAFIPPRLRTFFTGSYESGFTSGVSRGLRGFRSVGGPFFSSLFAEPSGFEGVVPYIESTLSRRDVGNRVRMTRFPLLVIMAIFTAIPCGAAMHSRPGAGTGPIDPSVPAPVITFDDMFFNFGKVPAQKAVTHAFVVVNTGKATLHIEEVKAVCGCTSTIVGKKDLEPGESTEIQAMYTPEKGFSGAARKTIMVMSNDPAHPRLTLRFAADVLPADAPKPASP
jgi:hypothetical protein